MKIFLNEDIKYRIDLIILSLEFFNFVMIFRKNYKMNFFGVKIPLYRKNLIVFIL